MLFDLKTINAVLTELEETRGVPREKVIEAIESALATAYRKEYGKKGQIVRAKFSAVSGAVEFFQVKEVVDDTKVIVRSENEDGEEIERAADDDRIFYNSEHHIFIEDARKIKKGAQLEDEIIFPLETKSDFGRIAAQTAKQVVIQKIREAEKVSVLSEYGTRAGEIVSGTVQRIERGAIFIDIGRATGILPYEEQIPGERYRQGERVRAYLMRVEDTPRGVHLRLSRAAPKFIEALFKQETPEVASGAAEIKAIAREPGSRAKIAVASNDPHIDPVGSLVGGRGVRVSTVMSELGGEKIDIIQWFENLKKFVTEALSPAKVLSVEVLDEAARHVKAIVADDQQSLAIGRGGQNVRLAARLTNAKIDIASLNKPAEPPPATAETEKAEPVPTETKTE
ncbi:MAG: transcription termination factor NusA [Candidatus Taylorbacteria bacterium RIFCSPLOWO2_02_FULL_48_16]|nr:MAG: transcription termination factor NusA [Candidatus Taylorbacteria bacterium RIFCSPLOWO2_02_FULL_48_16]